MYKHHETTIKKLHQELKKDKNVLALIIGGSLAKGYATKDSDVDCYIVLDEKTFKKKLKAQQLQYFNSEICQYKGGYVDGKIISQKWFYLGKLFVFFLPALKVYV